jgi:hypothetical protein
MSWKVSSSTEKKKSLVIWHAVVDSAACRRALCNCDLLWCRVKIMSKLAALKEKWLAQSKESRTAILGELSESADSWSNADGHAETLEDSATLKIVIEVMKELSKQ